MKKKTAKIHGSTNKLQSDVARSRERWFDWSAVMVGFLIYWTIILVGLSILWWSGELAMMRKLMMQKTGERLVELILPDGWQ